MEVYASQKRTVFASILCTLRAFSPQSVSVEALNCYCCTRIFLISAVAKAIGCLQYQQQIFASWLPVKQVLDVRSSSPDQGVF